MVRQLKLWKWIKSEHLIDAYCGVGTIGLAFAKKVSTIRGMDIIPEAIEDARKNAESLGLDNAHYEVGKAEDIIPRWYKEGYRADALIVDPPRTGLDSKLLKTILEYTPKKWYMSHVMYLLWQEI